MYRYIFNFFLRGQDPLAGLIKRIRDETRDTFMKCGYIRQTWDCGNTREVEEKHTGRYGARGQKRQKRRKATPEEIAKQNQWKRERDVRRLIKWNFGIGDYWFTLTYKKGSRPPWKQMQKDMSKFIRKLRDKYKKYGWELKYIYRLEIGKNGGPHVHILINRKSNDETDTGLLVETLWEHGHAQTKRVYDVDSGELAQYITKPLQDHEPEDLKRYHPSRNLIRKDPEKEEINRRSLLDKHGRPRDPKPPKGWAIVPNSVKCGKNKITGYAYRHYILIKTEKRRE
ncbi:rolling circle replication-associated protein [Blautia massiliensis (ex Durand et al. 2017)]|jgi:hypothetical protein|uniref:rolling circle replication-associated protein n=2 Tax=Blautia TaxID=572511 RepID=UPI00204A32E4|nr:hypothetical protein [Blautia massiliensis (ex Durand et al. 2017)]DAH04641.1 MAG TPA: protein of unknown function DUF1424 [Caudoviricetes sp.]